MPGWITPLFAEEDRSAPPPRVRISTLRGIAEMAEPFMAAWAQEIIRREGNARRVGKRLSLALVTGAFAKVEKEWRAPPRVALSMLSDFLPDDLVTPVRDLLHEMEMDEYDERTRRRDAARSAQLNKMMREAIAEAQAREAQEGDRDVCERAG